ncbi:MAG: hypothetical protein Q9217_001322 [Psora testacea]
MHSSVQALYTLSLTLITTLTNYITHTNAQACAAGSAKQILGNWYCSEVKAIAYSNFPGHGYYNRVTNMDADTGEFYTLDDAFSMKDKRGEAGANHRRQGGHSVHQNLHNRQHRAKRRPEGYGQRRALNDIVEVTMDGKLVSWTNDYAGTPVATGAALPNTADEVEGKVAPSSMSLSNFASGDQVSHYPAASISAFSPAETGSGGLGRDRWMRQAYYNAEDGTSEGITFLNHFGGVKGIPGTAAGGPAFGASLSYASSDGQSGAATSRVLKNAMIEDNAEVIILSAKACGDGGCGYTRPGGVAYHGFGGSHKVFLLEFSMPLTGKSGFNGDMPAIWLHNAQIPLTSQYGTNPDCSCWTSGCGEFDLFEVLDQGDMRCKSTLHMAPAGGSSDWFQRPTNETITAAVVFAGKSEVAVIRMLDDGQDFDETLPDQTVDGWIKKTSDMSMFKMGS